MKRTILALALLQLLLLASTSRADTTPTSIPTGETPSIDGTLANGEWKEAVHVELAPEGEAWLLQDEEALYVGLKVGGNCIPSLALLQGDDTVLVLHASASLGTAAYERSGGEWKATRGFEWRCRSGRTSDEDRQRFLADEGWYANTVEDGRKGEAEYRIDRRLLSGATPRLAVVACRLQPMPPTACAWPPTVEDGTRDQELLFGNTPNLELEPDTWAPLDLGASLSPAEQLDARLAEIEADDDPVQAYRALLDLLDEQGDEASDRARKLRKKLEKNKAVEAEAKAQRRLESAVKLLRKKLREIETKYPGTRAARIAKEQRESLDP